MEKQSTVHLPTSEEELGIFQRFFITDGRPFFPLAGQVHNSSAYSAATLERGWIALAALHANTAEIPVYWEQVEPAEGCFDFHAVDQILAGARAHGLKVILLWFGSWKNSLMKYTPAWVKADPQRFWRVWSPAGEALAVLSPLCPATREADQRAFCALLDHLHQADPDQATVIADQIENEPGLLGSDRDYSAAGESAFNSPVPVDLLAILQLAPRSQLYTFWKEAGSHSHGTWPEAFGQAAGELFTAWSLAQFVESLAMAGKAQHDLPMYVNAWISNYDWRAAGLTYPSGGATYNTLDIWRWAAPHVDLIAPDIYHSAGQPFCSACADYRRKDNTLFIPESPVNAANARNLFYALADYAAIGFGVFGVEDLLDAEGQPRPEAQPLLGSYHAAAAALPLILRYQGTNHIHAIVQEEDQNEQYLDLGEYLGLALFNVSAKGVFCDYRHLAPPPGDRGRGLVFQAGPREFFCVGSGYRLLLRPKKAPFTAQQAQQIGGPLDGRHTNYVCVEEGHFEAGDRWVADRARNGDETDYGLWVAPDVGVVHAILSD
jgi:hypothetical protein